jgi:hypothetical protein
MAALPKITPRGVRIWFVKVPPLSVGHYAPRNDNAITLSLTLSH